MILLGGLLVTAVGSSALYLFVLRAPMGALITWIVIGGIIGLVLGAMSGRRYGFLEGFLAGITGAVLAASLFLTIRREGGAVTFTRAVVAGVGAILVTVLARYLPGAKDPDVA